MIKSIIIENDHHAIEYLTSLLSKHSKDISIIGHAKTIGDGIKLIEMHSPELIFLDIELDDGNSFEILDNINAQNFDVVFTTGFNNYYEKALEHFAFSYLLKPINEVTLEKVIERYKNVRKRHFTESKFKHFREFIKKDKSKILLQTGNEYVSVAIEDIVCCKADGNYTIVDIKNKKQLLVSNVLKYYYNLFAVHGFFRANRSCLINVQHIDSIYKKETIILSTGEHVNVSVRNKSKLTELIETLM